jgi:hypothetical protein
LGLAITGAGVWYFQTGNNAPSVSSALTNLKPASSATNTSHSNAAASSSTDLQARAANNSSLGLFNEPVRSLMHSDKMAKIDYARLRVFTQCIAFMNVGAATHTVENSADAEAKLPDAEKPLFGHASLTTRRAALARSIAACSRLYEGSQLSADEMAAFNAQPNTAKWRALVKAGQKENFGADIAATKEFMEKIVSEPMFGAMEALLYGRLINSAALEKDYLPEQAMALRILVVPFLLCQMGDDCRSGGIVSEQLCWQSGIRGENVQDAILENLRSQQINTAAFEQFVTTLRQKTEQTSAYLRQYGGSSGK